MLQSQLRAASYLFGARGRTAFEEQVGTEKLSGAQHHGAIQAGAEIANGSARGHGHQQGKKQYA
ncbi:hypothetical protein D3C75_1111330 [compost metagenome]